MTIICIQRGIRQLGKRQSIPYGLLWYRRQVYCDTEGPRMGCNTTGNDLRRNKIRELQKQIKSSNFVIFWCF